MSEEQKEGAGTLEEKAAPPPPKNPLEERLNASFGDAVRTRYNRQGDLEISVRPEKSSELFGLLIGDAETPYDYLRNLTAIDWKDRLETVYHLCSTPTMTNIVVKCELDRGEPAVDSATRFWPGANWLEREVFDLFGIKFNGHPDLRRIMLPEEWQGHPLLKDYIMPED